MIEAWLILYCAALGGYYVPVTPQTGECLPVAWYGSVYGERKIR